MMRDDAEIVKRLQPPLVGWGRIKEIAIKLSIDYATNRIT
jgi:hypothetical protein